MTISPTKLNHLGALTPSGISSEKLSPLSLKRRSEVEQLSEKRFKSLPTTTSAEPSRASLSISRPVERIDTIDCIVSVKDRLLLMLHNALRGPKNTRTDWKAIDSLIENYEDPEVSTLIFEGSKSELLPLWRKFNYKSNLSLESEMLTLLPHLRLFVQNDNVGFFYKRFAILDVALHLMEKFPEKKDEIANSIFRDGVLSEYCVELFMNPIRCVGYQREVQKFSIKEYIAADKAIYGDVDFSKYDKLSNVLYKSGKVELAINFLTQEYNSASWEVLDKLISRILVKKDRKEEFLQSSAMVRLSEVINKNIDVLYSRVLDKPGDDILLSDMLNDLSQSNCPDFMKQLYLRKFANILFFDNAKISKRFILDLIESDLYKNLNNKIYSGLYEVSKCNEDVWDLFYNLRSKKISKSIDEIPWKKLDNLFRSSLESYEKSPKFSFLESVFRSIERLSANGEGDRIDAQLDLAIQLINKYVFNYSLDHDPSIYLLSIYSRFYDIRKELKMRLDFVKSQNAGKGIRINKRIRELTEAFLSINNMEKAVKRYKKSGQGQSPVSTDESPVLAQEGFGIDFSFDDYSLSDLYASEAS